jgi:glycosyltransferase involved in cell wall biosynthesis
VKKNLLFIMNKLVCGGSEKALISVLETIDYTKYNVDLFLFKHEGIFMNKIPKEVNLLPEPEYYKYFDRPFKSSIAELIKKGKWGIAFNRGILGYLAKTEKNGAVIEQKLWKYLTNTLKSLRKEYDAAIGFQEKNPIYFCVDKVKAKIKIGWIHTDYNKLGLNLEKERAFFNDLDYVVTVSEELVHILKGNFPDQQHKFKCIYNIVSPKVIQKMSLEKVAFHENKDKSVNLISVGRLAKEKGLDISFEACKTLINKGYNLRWYLIGEGNVRQELEHSIRQNNLEDRVILLGQKENPYPYIRQADIYLQTSRYEGKSISIDEAKILAKPILITNFKTAKNHLHHQKNGIISEMDPTSVAKDLEKLIKDPDLSEKLASNLKKESLGTENEIIKLYQLIEGKGSYQNKKKLAQNR